MELWLPYGETEIPIRIPDHNFYRILEPKKPSAVGDVRALVENALENPLGGYSLNGAVKPGATAGIVVDPIVPLDARREAVKIVTSRLLSLGVENTKVFLRKRMSRVEHSPDDGKPLDPSQNSFVEIGKTSMGTIVDLDPELIPCEVKVSIGLAMPHFASGFSGGPEIVIPSSSSTRSITKNRSILTKGFPDPLNHTDNPILSDSLEACKLTGPVYSLCFLPDGYEGVAAAFAGELESVFRETLSQYAQLHSPRIERKLDIVVVSAGPLMGTDLYHAIRVVSNAIGAVKREGTIILVAECSQGVGDSVFLDYARRFREPKELSTELGHRFKLGGHVNLFLQYALEKCRIQLVSVLPELFVRDTFNLKPSQTASEAVQKAVRVEGKESKILIVPKGDFTVPTMEP
ncbi:DUF2088 domain-containing protein [Candidatus Bathyarchaeota archaeon]|nr:MAG: DUF2088 domain-containing protein [Candidatus Bathyarchaeota archaeon]